MEKIASFTVNHLDLLEGIYVSRKDYLKEDVLTTFDLRFTRPNLEPVLDNVGLHAIEHLGATFLRNHPVWKERTIYFGPMGCRTGFYVIFSGDLEPENIWELMKEMCLFIQEFEGEIPGATPRDCGNYRDLNLDMAKYYIRRWHKVLEDKREERMNYPQ